MVLYFVQHLSVYTGCDLVTNVMKKIVGEGNRHNLAGFCCKMLGVDGEAGLRKEAK